VRREYEIQRGLLEETIETRRKIAERRRGGLTAGLSVDQIDTAVASRRAALRSVRQRVGDAQDSLVRLLADERINLRSDCVVVPVTEMEEESVVLEEKDQLLTALRHSPRLEQARLLIRAREIDVTVANGMVTLEGTVEDTWQKWRAEDLVADLSGVILVENHLTVVPTESFVDQDIAEDIESALERNLYVVADDVTVEVENGTVTLSGTVTSWAARRAAYEAALYTTGVVDVRNLLSVLTETEEAAPPGG